jgi:hypothetical protein
VADDLVVRVGGERPLAHLDAEAGAADDLGDLDDRLDDHVGGHVPPAVQGLPERQLEGPRRLGLGTQRELAVGVHLVPGDLVEQGHRAVGMQPVEGLP